MKAGIKYGTRSSFSYGFFFMCVLATYAFAFFIGSRILHKNVYNDNKSDYYSAGDIIIIFFAITTGSFGF